MAFETAKRWAGAHLWLLRDRGAFNRLRLYDGLWGLRVLTFHETGAHEIDRVRRAIQWCEDHHPIAGPERSDDIFAGGGSAFGSDEVLFTFDDGYESNFAIAEWLAARGIRAVFFVVPSLVNRTAEQYLEFHRRRGVEAHPLLGSGNLRHCRGLSAMQVEEMLHMGHRVAAHNYAHRDLGHLTLREDLEYEIQRSVDEISELTQKKCRDFAVGFGQPENLSIEAEAFLRECGQRVFMCFRGLNLPGRTTSFLMRHDVARWHPLVFLKAALACAGDHTVAERKAEMLRRTSPLSRPLRHSQVTGDSAGGPGGERAQDASEARP